MPQAVYEGNPEDYQELIENGYDFHLNNYLNRAWELFKAYPGGFIGFFLLSILILGTAGSFGLSWVLQGPLTIAYFIVAHKAATGDNFEFGDFFPADYKFFRKRFA